MALTTDSAQQIADNIVADRDLSTAPRRPTIVSDEAKILLNKSIVARPLMAPEVCSIHVKNTEYYYRWVASHALGGQIYAQRRAMGFINATNDDVDILVGEAVADKGEVRCGDLILMKMPYTRWAGHVKYNMERSLILGNARGLYNKNTPSTSVWADDQPQRATVSQEAFDRRGTAKTFIPDNPEAIIDGSIASGQVEKTRRVVETMRENARKG